MARREVAAYPCSANRRSAAPRSASRACALLRIPKGALVELLEGSPAEGMVFYKNLARLLVQRLNEELAQLQDQIGRVNESLRKDVESDEKQRPTLLAQACLTRAHA